MFAVKNLTNTLNRKLSDSQLNQTLAIYLQKSTQVEERIAKINKLLSWVEALLNYQQNLTFDFKDVNTDQLCFHSKYLGLE